MNIAFDAGAIEVGKGSGVGNYTYNQFKSLMQLYPDDNFFYFNIINDSFSGNHFEADNLTIRNFFMGQDYFLRHYEGEYQDILGELIRKFIIENEIDVFYVTAPFLTTPDIGFNVVYKKEWFNGIHVVATVYDIIPYIMRKQYLPSKEAFSWYTRCLEFLKTVSRLLVISNSVKNDLMHYLEFSPQNIDIIYGGVSDKYKMQQIPDDIKKTLFQKFKITQEYVFCAVSADWRKNTEGVIEAFSLLPQDLQKRYQLVIAGRLSNRFKHEEDLRNRGLEGQVILTDYIQSDEELIQLYNLSKFVIIPSLYEGFGLPVLEAWACGKAVLASNNSSLGEIVGDTGILFDPTNTKDMARALTIALTSAPLHELAMRGHEKLEFYSWDNVATLTMDAINKLFNFEDSPSNNININMKIKCIFAESITPTWKAFLHLLNIDYITTLEDEEYDKNLTDYDRVLYFSSMQNCNKIANPSRTALVLLDDSMRSLIELVTNKNNEIDEEGLGLQARESFYNNKNSINTLEDLSILQEFDRIIVADLNMKVTMLKNPALIGKICCIKPTIGNYIFDKAHDEISKVTLLNFQTAIADECLIKAPHKWLDKIKSFGNVYSSTENIQKLSSTLSYAFGTDPLCKTVKIPPRPLQVLVITSWNTACGIAEYTRYFVEQAESQVQFEIWANKTNETKTNETVLHGLPDLPLPLDDERVKSRTWQNKGNIEDLIKGLETLESKPDAVHIQYTEGFFSLEALERIINSIKSKVIITCHNTKFLQPNKHSLDNFNKAHYVVHQEDEIKQLKSFGLKHVTKIPLGHLTNIPIPKEKIRKMLQIKECSPIIGSYGFLLPHKGVLETIEAVAILKIKYPNILFIACTSLHVSGASEDYLKSCENLIVQLQLQENVKMITKFLNPQESLYLLQACDVLVLPYGGTVESSSGAVRFCTAARRPLVLTKQPIFSDISGISGDEAGVLIKNNSPNHITEGVLEVLDKYDKYISGVSKLADKNNWDEIVNKYMKLYTEH